VTEALPALQGLGLSELAAYANAGETFAAGHWCGARVTPTAFAVHAAAWIAAGATLVGGCCRTTPGHIAALAELVARRT
jgi:homocysteine S-methyltransferase